MTVGVYPGSFDPVTLGHLDIIKRSSKIVDRLIIGVLNNSAKKPVFTAEERVHMLELVIKDIPNAAVETFDGLTVEFAKSLGATVMFRGLRAVTDFEYEIQIAQTNHALNPDIDTVFLTTSVKYSYLSSSIVKEVASYEGDISKFVPGEILPFVTGKIKNLRSVDNGNGQKQ
ncbi:MAG: pantetheine-phosphate adenylyltransferase [Lachnospiraceae bacterium]|jgi:pantetheine-phosphate adenylyltransferase|nr:pantetheine-phosphate adenylyltransferase [Lachnospiraceae bacterium]MCX4346367.1 pantetheine-phosphate adenylyltransferase [Lachnospiraceae bacterium]